MSCPLWFPSSPPRDGEVISGSNHQSCARLEGGGRWGGAPVAPTYITVAVGNRIHQIKSSIHLRSSGDTVGGRGWGWPKGERVTLTPQTEWRGWGRQGGMAAPCGLLLHQAGSERTCLPPSLSSSHYVYFTFFYFDGTYSWNRTGGCGITRPTFRNDNRIS